MIQRITFSFLILILVFQISTLRPDLISFGEHSFGTLSLASEDTKEYLGKIFTEATLTTSQPQETYDSLVFTGDVMLGRHVETLLAKQGTSTVYAGFSLKNVSTQPAVIGNFEAAAALPHVQTPAHTLRFSVAEEHIEAFGNEFTHASLANNHSLDFGEVGYKNAVTLLENAGVTVFGHNSTLNFDSLSYVETERGTVAMIGINATQSIPESKDIDAVCGKAKRVSDFQIVYIHWGEEYSETHSSTQRALAEELVQACADIIVGHHPHVIQDVDIIRGVPVFYSLGNYIFDQYFSDEVQEGLVVVLRLEEVPFLELIPVSSKEIRSVPHVAQAADRTTILQKMAQNSHESLQSAILDGRINLFEPVATSTKMAIMSR